MSSYVLVHGAWHGGWCWERVAALLRARGHDVLTPTLTGLGERADELTPQVGLAEHVRDTLDALEQTQSPAVLAGHSYAGLVVREVAALAPGRVRELVLVDGWVGPRGSSLMSLAPQWFADGMRAAAADGGEGWRIPAPDPAVVGVTAADDAAWLRERLTAHPLRTFEDDTSGEPPGTIPQRALLADPGPVPFAEMARRLDIPTTQLTGGHDLMLTATADLADALLESA